MAKFRIIASRCPSILLFMSLITSAKTRNTFHPLELFPRSSNSCPSSYNSCGAGLPDTFCCPSSSTCIGLDNNSSAICCPSGSDCGYITPIVCDVQEQNATSHPKASVKTTKLDNELPQCGDACCPFGYTCQGNNTCVLDKKTSTIEPISTASDPATTTISASTTSGTSTLGATFRPVSSPSTSASTDSSNSLTSTCPSFPSRAVVAGFFPGALFGAVLALMVSTCFRHRQQKREIQSQDPKSGLHWSQRSSSGAILGISSPIASEDNSYRTDFLLRPGNSRRASTGGRSMLSRTGTRVRSLFSNNPRIDKDVPPIPPVPNPVTPPRQRQPSTESIKVYSPPGAFAQSRKFLGPEPYPGTIARPDTTFTDLVKAVGFNDRKGNPPFNVTETRKT